MRWVLVALFCGLFVNSRGGIVESDDWLVGSRQHKLIDRLKEHLGAPGTLRQGEAYLLIEAGGAYCTVILVGPQKSAAKVYAEVLSAWSARESQYSQENDYAAAAVDLSRGRFFQPSSSTTTDVEKLLERIKAVGLTPYLGLSVPKYATIVPNGLPVRHEGKRTLLLDPQVGGKPVTVSAKLGSVEIVGLFVVLFGPCLAVLASFALGVWFGKREHIELERRRAMYKNLIRWGSLGSIAVCLPFAFWFLFSGQAFPLLDLWFGTPSVFPLIPFLFLGMLLPMVALFPVGRFEERLFSAKGPNDPSFTSPVVERKSIAPKKIKVITILLLVLGIAVYIGTSFLPKEVRNDYSLVRIGGLLLIFAAPSVAGFIARRTSPGLATTFGDDPIVRKVDDFARRLGCGVHSVEIIDAKDSSGSLQVYAMRGSIFIDRRALSELPERELDFAIANALSSGASMSAWRLLLMMLPAAALMMGAMFILRQQGVSGAYLMLSVMALSVVGVMLLGLPALRANRRRALRAALRVTGDFEAARNCLQKSADEMIDASTSRRAKYIAATMDDLQWAWQSISAKGRG